MSIFFPAAFDALHLDDAAMSQAAATELALAVFVLTATHHGLLHLDLGPSLLYNLDKQVHAPSGFSLAGHRHPEGNCYSRQ
jgi:hypothetical protein